MLRPVALLTIPTKKNKVDEDVEESVKQEDDEDEENTDNKVGEEKLFMTFGMYYRE